MLPGISSIAGMVGGVDEIDPHWANVVFYSTLEGVEGGTSWTDLSPNAHPISIGAGAIETDTDLVGPTGGNGSSTLFPDAAGPRLEVPSHPDFNFSTNDFTIEWFINTRVFDDTYQGYFSIKDSTVIRISRWRSGLNAGKLSMNIASTLYTTDYIPNVVDTWQHWEICRDGSTARMYVDGVQVWSGNIGNPTLSEGVLTIGALAANNFSAKYSMGHVRVTNGVCRHPDGLPFVPPTLPFPVS